MKKYEELSENLKEEARALNPIDYTKWLYKVKGVEIFLYIVLPSYIRQYSI